MTRFDDVEGILETAVGGRNTHVDGPFRRGLQFTAARHLIRLCCLSLALYFAGNSFAPGQQIPLSPQGGGQTASLAGKWSYRSFTSEPDLSVEPNRLLFGSGTIDFSPSLDENLTGTLGGQGWRLNLTGTAKAGNPQTLRFQGRGMIGGEQWVYDYLGYVVPAWPSGVNQRLAIVGTIVRTAPHSDGQGGVAPAGVVAQWIAVKQDASNPAALLRQQVPGPSRVKLWQMYLQEELENYRRKANELSLSEPSLQALHANALPGVPLVAPQSHPPSLQPVTIQSQNGRLDAELVIAYSDLQIGNDPVHLRTYNGQLMGPVLRAKAGDTLYITVRNNLPAEPAIPGGGHVENGHHEWNTTNLHFHGLHVAPQGTQQAESDNVLLSIPPGGVQKYEVHIPPDHVAGTFWYHAHRHGSTAAQVASGMAGALIIERDDNQHNLDSVPAIAAAVQEVMVLQAVPYLKTGTGPGEIERAPDGSTDNEDAMFAPGQWRALRRYITVNGIKIPTITVAPGEVRRLRFVATGQRESMKLHLEKAGSPGDRLKFYEIAVDGLPTGNLRAIDELELFPGFRSDTLIQPPANATGEYYLVDANAASGSGADHSPEPLNRVARIVVSGAPVAMSLPDVALLKPHRLTDLVDTDATGTQYAFYGIVNANGASFYISRKQVQVGQIPAESEFDPASVRILPSGHTERWEVGSRNEGLNVTHPFHIHLNPFLVTQVLDGASHDVTVQEFGGPIWRDTLAMKQGYTYKFLTRYADYNGDFVSHCHILDHEDQGMMEHVRIGPANAGSATGQAPSTAVAAAESRVVPSVDSVAPDFILPDAEGKFHTLAEIKGKSVVFFFKGHGCLHCAQQVAAFTAHYQSFVNAGIQVIGVTSDNSDTLKSALGSFPCPFRLLADPQGVAFASFGCVTAGVLQHGTFCLDPARQVKWYTLGSSPYVNVTDLIEKLVPSALARSDAPQGNKELSTESFSRDMARVTPKAKSQ